MFEIFTDFFEKKRIDCYGILPLEACKLQKPYLLERVGIQGGSVIIMAIPYYTHACEIGGRNLSAYAVAKDYHLFFRSLFDELLPMLQNQYPQESFVGFADHSPIDEIHAAALAGLGVIGKNRLLLTEKYSSYVFLGEIFTSAVLPHRTYPIRTCEDCGACQAACPAQNGEECLSSLTQKKGQLTEAEAQRILDGGSVWGCDRCQDICPYTARAVESGTIYSPIPFFSEQTLPILTTTALARMDDEQFFARAYSWRRRETVERNIAIIEKGEQTC